MALFTTFLLLLLAPTCYSFEPAKFQNAWDQFIHSQELEEQDNGSEECHEYEFLLLNEFTEQQISRHRPYFEEIDRHAHCRPYLENKIALNDGTEMGASLIQFHDTLLSYQNFIATQAPFKHNIHLFWQMIWEQQIDQIVMVTELLETRHPTRELSAVYWPQQIGEKITLENGLAVTLLAERELLSELKEIIQIRTFNLHCQGQNKQITHYWYRNWMDGECPTEHEAILTLIQTVAKNKKSDSPILVHCHAGVGRTGVFIALYYLMESTKHQSKINLLDFVAYLRWQRPYLVSNYPQYRFCYEFHEHFNKQNLLR